MGQSLNIRVMERLAQVSSLNWLNDYDHLTLPFDNGLNFVLKDHVEEWNAFYSGISTNSDDSLVVRLKATEERLDYIPLFSYLYADDRPIIRSQQTGSAAFNLTLPEDAVLIREALKDIKNSDETIDPYILNGMMKLIVKKADTPAMESFFNTINDLVDNDRIHRSVFSIMRHNLSSQLINVFKENDLLDKAVPDVDDLHDFFRIANKHSLDNLFGNDSFYSYAHERALALYAAHDQLNDDFNLSINDLLKIQQKLLSHFEIEETNAVNRLRAFAPENLKDHAHVARNTADTFFSRLTYDISLVDKVLKRDINNLSTSLGSTNAVNKLEEELGCSWIDAIRAKVQSMVDAIDANLRDDIARKFYEINVSNDAGIKAEQDRFIDDLRQMLLDPSDEFRKLKTKDVLMRFESISGFADKEFRSNLFNSILDAQNDLNRKKLDKIDNPADYNSHSMEIIRKMEWKALNSILKGFSKIKGSRSEKPAHDLIKTLNTYSRDLSVRVEEMASKPADSVPIRDAFELILERNQILIMTRHMYEQFGGKTAFKQFKLNEPVEIDGEFKTPYQALQDILKDNIDSHYEMIDAYKILYPKIDQILDETPDQQFNQTLNAGRYLSSEYIDEHVSKQLQANQNAQIYANFTAFGNLEPLLGESIDIVSRFKASEHILRELINDELGSADLIRKAEMDLVDIQAASTRSKQESEEVVESIYENTL